MRRSILCVCQLLLACIWCTEMPGLQLLRRKTCTTGDKPLRGARIVGCTHVTSKSAVSSSSHPSPHSSLHTPLIPPLIPPFIHPFISPYSISLSYSLVSSTPLSPSPLFSFPYLIHLSSIHCRMFLPLICFLTSSQPILPCVTLSLTLPFSLHSTHHSSSSVLAETHTTPPVSQ